MWPLLPAPAPSVALCRPPFGAECAACWPVCAGASGCSPDPTVALARDFCRWSRFLVSALEVTQHAVIPVQSILTAALGLWWSAIHRPRFIQVRQWVTRAFLRVVCVCRSIPIHTCAYTCVCACACVSNYSSVFFETTDQRAKSINSFVAQHFYAFCCADQAQTESDQ